MDGSYGNVYGGNLPMSPGTQVSNNEQYKVNVSRQKTKKWANFKPQNYDGDDWGAEDDEDPEDTPPPPPLKPMGPRQPSTLPSTTRQFTTPAGPPPSLQLQTQRAASTPSGPVSAGGTLERTGLGVDNIVSPESAVPQSAAATVSSLQSSTPPVSAHPGAVHAAHPPRTTSRSPPAVAPGNTVPAANRFPPRKSSMGAHDAPPPLAGLAPNSRPGSRPGSSSHNKPWTEQRSSSPTTARSPLSPNKILPFIRPADIYRRMEEEKEKERRSMDSAGRPSLDTLGLGSPKAPAQAQTHAQVQAQAQAEPAAQKRQEESADVGRNLQPSLALVAERKSEYGLEGLIASYGSEDPESPVAASSFAAPASEPPKSNPVPPFQPGPRQSTSSTEPAEKLRRFSSSPKLPELGRMSGFAEDLFAVPSRFSAEPPNLPSIPSNSQSQIETSPVMAPSAMPALPTASEQASVRNSNDVVQAGAGIQPAQGPSTELRSPSPPNQPNQPVGLPAHQERATAAEPDGSPRRDPVASESRQAASNTEDKQPARPSLPGGWVSETIATPGEVPTPTIPDNSRMTAPKTQSGDVSPLAESFNKPTLDGVSDIVSEASAVKPQASTPSHQGSPLALPPLRTASPALSTSMQITSNTTASQVIDATFQPRDVRPGDLEPTGSVPAAAATQGPEIPPTAPLNPSRSLQNVGLPEEFVPPPGIETSSTLDTTSSSPVKESDMLREEIMRSLSPLSASNDYLEATGGGTAAYHAAAGAPVRESTYLGDVYGDYWEASEDKPAPGLSDSANKAGLEKITEAATPPPVDGTTQVLATPPTAPIQDPAPATASSVQEKPGGLRRRFSWETMGEDSNAPGSQRSVAAVQPEQRPSGSETSNTILETAPAASAQIPSLSIPTLETASGSLSGQAPSSGISHQVSGASTIPPRSTDGPIEPPSPISDSSRGDGLQVDNRRLSTTEDKVLVQPSTKPPSTPSSEHFVVPSEPHPPQQTSATPSSPTRSTGDLVSIMTFRQIMELPLPSERVKAFNSTRSQFAAIELGLHDWMSTMTTQHNEHANASWSFKTGVAGSGAVLDTLQGDQTPSHGNFQQHHSTGSPGFGANMPQPPIPQHGHGSSPFAHMPHSSAEIGTKSKKLLMAAGKAGKGIFNKGKNKLINS